VSSFALPGVVKLRGSDRDVTQDSYQVPHKMLPGGGGGKVGICKKIKIFVEKTTI
jgi:hypothetical protein